MNAILLTVLAIGGAGGYGGEYDGACEACATGHGHGGHGHADGHHCACLGPMPQSCYEPSFGCYASTRFMQRYPAFHGYYYRSAYNYRHYFDYPWHAGLHEPTSNFSYNVPGQAAGESIIPPAPMPEAASAATRSVIRSSYQRPIVEPIGTPTPAKPRALRR
jgi:hypothetical protein